MIVRSHPAGRSFKWLATHLTHDPKAQTSDRVLFTHTLNLAFDDVGSAVDTMLRTYWARDILKKEAGVRPGGSSVEKPVKHVSLAWHPSENPSEKTMIAAAESYLQTMGWSAHEALVVGHAWDRQGRARSSRPHATSHPHLHIMVNVIHPEKGTRLDDRFERRRAQEWALAHEKEHGKIVCPARLKPIAERKPSPPRNVWEELRELKPQPAIAAKSLRTADYDAPPHLWRRQEWTILKEQQKAMRMTFFQDLGGPYRVYRQEIYDTTGVYFRREWMHYFQLKRQGASVETLKAMKEDIAARQKAQYRQAVRDAMPRVQEERDVAYRRLLADQKGERAKLIDRQEQGLPSLQLKNRPPFTVAVPPTVKPPTPKPPPPHRAPERTFVWPAKAGMVAQQRTAVRWLDRALDRIRRERSFDQPAAGRSRFAQPVDRTVRKEAREKGAAAGVEPDGCRGSGL